MALKDFTPYAKATTERIANNARRLVTDTGRPVISFDHVKTRNRPQLKEELARQIAERDGNTEGIICLISAVETCMSFQVRKNMKTGRIDATERKCLHHYLYAIDPEFGFRHVRIQGWIPYDIQVYVNGREWLARQLDKAGIGYARYDNSLLAIDDLAAAAKLCERFAHRAWKRVLNAFARRLNPMLGVIQKAGYGGYYWVLDQAEIATDVMFKTSATARALARPGPSRRPQPVLRRCPGLLGAQAAPVAQGPGGDRHQATARGVAGPTPHGSQLSEGLRQGLGPAGRDRHQQSGASSGCCASSPTSGRRERRWCPMRKGVGDLWRNYEVGIGANHRYLEALAAAPLKGEGVAALHALCRPGPSAGGDTPASAL